MNIKLRFFLTTLIFILLSNNSCYKIQNKEQKHIAYKNELTTRIHNLYGIHLNIPNIKFSDTIISNAQYKGNTILIGNRFYSDEYFTDEDRLSILLHEYMHYVTEKLNLFQCDKNETGDIIQINTNQIYETTISEIELKNDLKTMKNAGISKEQINSYKTSAKLPVIMKFIYSPSNLSLDELLCYITEKVCHNMGVFNHSNQYRILIDSRIRLEKKNFNMRKAYEKANNLNSYGSLNK